MLTSILWTLVLVLTTLLTLYCYYKCKYGNWCCSEIFFSCIDYCVRRCQSGSQEEDV